MGLLRRKRFKRCSIQDHRRRAIEKVAAKIKKRGKNLVIYPEECPVSLSICLWKKKESRSWEEIERCYAYAGHKDGVVRCKWKETLFGKQEREKIKRIRKKVKGKINRG